MTLEGTLDRITPMQRLWALTRLERNDVATIAIYAATAGVLGLTTPIAVQALVSTVAFGTVIQPLFVLALMLLVAFAASSLLRGLHAYVVEVLQQRFFLRVVADVAYRVPRARRDALDGFYGPELVNRFFDVFTVQKGLASLLVGGVELVLTALVGMLVLAFYHPLLLAMDVLLMLAVVAIGVWPWSRGTQTAIQESKRKYALAAWLQSVAQHPPVFRLAGGLSYAEQRTADLARGYLDARRQHFRVTFGQLVALLCLQAMASAGVLGLGGWLVIRGQLTLGQLVAAELVVTAVVASLAKLGRYLDSGYDTLAGLDKLGRLTDLEVDREGGDTLLVSGPLSIALDAVSAGRGDGTTLRDVTLQIHAGDRVAITGPGAGGKTLLTELIVGLRAPRDGRVRLNDRDSTDLSLSQLRERIAVVSGSALFADSVFDNVRMGRPTIDLLRARDALSAVGLESEIDALPQGGHTLIGWDGSPLSQSQALRLTLARAMAGEPALLVIDQALDGLDDAVLARVMSSLTHGSTPWTLVVVSQDPRVIGRCGRRLHVEDGSAREVTT